MKRLPVEKIRNIGIMAHIDAGKTTTTERILYYTGVTYKMGEVDDGTAVMDWMDQEQERGITITSAATSCFWNDYRINIIDTPGHVDFTAEVERSLRVLDGTIVILCGVGGVEPQTEKVWYQSEKYRIPKIAYINKMDRIGADYSEVVNQLEEKFAVETLQLQLPLGIEEHFAGIIDLLEMKAARYKGELLGVDYDVVEIPNEFRDEAEMMRDHLVEKLANHDLQIMELFLEKKQVSTQLMKKAIRKATLDLQAVPVIMGSSFKNKAVQHLLDAVVDYLPSPADKPDIQGFHPKSNEPQVRKLSDSEPFSALVFKIMTDPHMGQLIYFRVYSGHIKSGDYVYNSTKKKRVRVQRLLKMHSNKREEVPAVYSGEITATVGINEISTGDTLCDERHPIVLESISFPEPVITSTIEPRLTSEHDKLDLVLKKISEEDPTFKVRVDRETGQQVISGMGELHLEVIQERMKREFTLETKLGKPRVAYHETIRLKSSGEEKYERQSGGKSHYGHVVLEIGPHKGKEKFSFRADMKSDRIPKQYFSAIEEGIVESLDNGVIAGYPITNIQVSLLDGSYHEGDSDEIAYKIAATQAFQKAFKKGNPCLLEPIMKIEILVQDEYVGEVIGDFNSREGKVTSMRMNKTIHIIDGQVPLANMFGYATVLRTLTQGRANYSMEFFNYEEMNDKKMTQVLRDQLGIFSINKEVL